MKPKLILLCVVVIFILQACTIPNESNNTSFTAKEGNIDLSEWDNDKSLVHLNGQWSLYWNQLLDPTDFTSGSSVKQTGMISMPSIWHTQSINGKSLPKEGFATFRLDVSMEEIDEVMGLRIPYMHSNFNLWIDDELLASNGQVGTSAATSVPEKHPKIVYFSPKNNTFSVTLQISNYDYAVGGLLEPIILGKSDNIHSSHFKETIAQSILLGILIFSGIYHIGLGFFRKTEPYFFYFGIFCLVAPFRYLMVGNVFFTKIFPNIDWALAMKLDYISLYSHVPLFAMVLYRLYPQHSYKWVTIFSFIVTAFYDMLTILTPAKTYQLFTVYFQLFMITGVCYALFVVVKSLNKKHVESYFLLTGIVFLMTTILLDIFNSLLNYPDSNFYPIGIATFIICFSLIISKRLSSSLDLSVGLAEDLSRLNSDLENKVEQRTQQIQHSNKKLEAINEKLRGMALIDGLTNIPNRRQFDEYYKEQFEICADENTSFSILY
ncbi:sensor domain-containing diguanylate cyclase [Salipaludibacillus sp. CF4.18]|uniref:sensor domain-containing diguanylate cyclase n=1 Tax=Salipaludibacillus sp. CF4.18 TaxID=3373081 RepID=UPI003EE42BD4